MRDAYFHHDAGQRPLRLKHQDCTGDFRIALAAIRSHLRWRASPEGVLQTLRERLADAERDLSRAKNQTERTRIETDLADLKRQVFDQEQLVKYPEQIAQRVEESIARGIERERQLARPVNGVTRFINPPPGIAPFYFQNRHVETRIVSGLLKEDAQRLISVVGRAGVGKTATVCRLLKALERGQLPDDGGALPVNGIVYVSAAGSRRVTMPNLFADLCHLLPDDKAGRLDALYRDPHVTTPAKVRALLAEFPTGQQPTVLLLDNFEDIVNAETFQIADAELAEALRAVLEAPSHSVKVVITTRVAPVDLALVKPVQQTRLDLDEGLDSPFAENILREMDTDGKVGLKARPPRCCSTHASAPEAIRALWRRSLPSSPPTATPRLRSCWPTRQRCCLTTWLKSLSAKPSAASILLHRGSGDPSPPRRWTTFSNLW